MKYSPVQHSGDVCMGSMGLVEPINLMTDTSNPSIFWAAMKKTCNIFQRKYLCSRWSNFESRTHQLKILTLPLQQEVLFCEENLLLHFSRSYVHCCCKLTLWFPPSIWAYNNVGHYIHTFSVCENSDLDKIRENAESF